MRRRTACASSAGCGCCSSQAFAAADASRPPAVEAYVVLSLAGAVGYVAGSAGGWLLGRRG